MCLFSMFKTHREVYDVFPRLNPALNPSPGIVASSLTCIIPGVSGVPGVSGLINDIRRRSSMTESKGVWPLCGFVLYVQWCPNNIDCTGADVVLIDRWKYTYVHPSIKTTFAQVTLTSAVVNVIWVPLYYVFCSCLKVFKKFTQNSVLLFWVSSKGSRPKNLHS